MSIDYGFEIDAKEKIKPKRSLIEELDELESEPATLVSSIFNKSKENKKHEKEIEKESEYTEDDEPVDGFTYTDIDEDWADTLLSFKTPKVKRDKRSKFSGFDLKKKKKKKNKKGKSEKDYKKEFAPELMLLQNLQKEQSDFVKSLQRKYDQMENTKSSARGVGKYTTDLINGITSARSVSMQLINNIISTKKTIADLDFKERKEFGNKNSDENSNVTNYASSYLREIIQAGRNNVVGQPEAYDNFNTYEDLDSEGLFDSIAEGLEDTSNLSDNELDEISKMKRSDESELYLKYENSGVQVHVLWHDSYQGDDLDKQYDFLAYDKDGNVVDDYPEPIKTRMSLNREAGKAVDMMGTRYILDIVD